MKREDLIAVNFRFPKILVDRLRKDADTGHRNFSQEVIMRLEASYENGRHDVRASGDRDRTPDTGADNEHSNTNTIDTQR